MSRPLAHFSRTMWERTEPDTKVRNAISVTTRLPLYRMTQPVVIEAPVLDFYVIQRSWREGTEIVQVGWHEHWLKRVHANVYHG